MMTAHLNREATYEDYLAFREKAELIDGRIVPMTPTGYLPGWAASLIHRSLERHAAEVGGGEPVSQGVGFLLQTPRTQVLVPDVAWWTGAVGLPMEQLRGAPALAVEVRSKNDYGPTAEREMEHKRALYFAAGTQVVWDADLARAQVIRAYRADSPATPLVFRPGEAAHAEPAVPGWRFEVAQLFPDHTKSATRVR